MKPKFLLAAIVFFAVLAAGCGELPSYGARDTESRQVIALIDYAQRVAAMRPEEQSREFSDANKVFSRDSGNYARLRLALLLSLPGTAFNDDARAAALLEPLAAGGRDPAGPLREFAGLLYAQVAERVREQRRSAQLRGQLDALKAIERSIIERGRGR